MAKRYIDLELANKLVCEICEYSEGTLCYGCDDNPLGFLEEKDVVTVVHGRWREVNRPTQSKKAAICECSECGDTVCVYDGDRGWNYYPNCGARMEEKHG